MQTIRANDPRLTWQGAVSLETADDFVMPWRIPHEQRGLFAEALQLRASQAAGVRVSFHSDTSTISGSVVLDAQAEEEAQIDLYCDGEFQGTADILRADEFGFQNLPSGEKLIELWVPQFAQFRLRSLQIDDGATIEPFDDQRPKWITYGSSISHCRAAESPSQTWPGIVARESNLDLTCLGYGGNCHAEPMVARMIRDMPADYISMKVGINIYGAASLSERTFREAIIGFVQIVREKHPDTPFALISSIISPPRETTLNDVGFTMESMREQVEAAAEALRSHGDKHIMYFDGLKLMGADEAHMLPDDVHPSAEGYKIMGGNFLKEIAPTFFV